MTPFHPCPVHLLRLTFSHLYERPEFPSSKLAVDPAMVPNHPWLLTNVKVDLRIELILGWDNSSSTSLIEKILLLLCTSTVGLRARLTEFTDLPPRHWVTLLLVSSGRPTSHASSLPSQDNPVHLSFLGRPVGLPLHVLRQSLYPVHEPSFIIRSL